MAFELFLLAVPRGCDLEEAGEALLARLASGHERASLTEEGRAAAQDLARRLMESDAGLAPCESSLPGTVEMRDASGLEVVLARRFARFLVPFTHYGESAAVVFRRLFDLASAAEQATGWHPYDPQEGEGLSLSEEGCAAALEVYLSVMDQLRPEAATGGGRGTFGAA